MAHAVLSNLFSLLSPVPLRFPPSSITQWSRPLLGAGSSKDGTEDGANWQDKLLAGDPPRSCSPRCSVLGHHRNGSAPRCQLGRWLPLRGSRRDSDAAFDLPTSGRAHSGHTKCWKGAARGLQRHLGSVLNQQRLMAPSPCPRGSSGSQRPSCRCQLSRVPVQFTCP